MTHFLCTNPSLQGRGYAKRIMKVVFSQGEMINKNVYGAIKLPKGYKITEYNKNGEPRAMFEKSAHYSGWNDRFWEKMSFTFYNNSYTDVVDECDHLMYGSSTTFSGNAGSARLMKHNPTTYILYELDSHTKYSIAFNPNDNLMYSKYPHFG